MAPTVEKFANALGGTVADGQAVLDFLADASHSAYVAPLLWLVDAVLCALIIRTVNCVCISVRSYFQCRVVKKKTFYK